MWQDQDKNKYWRCSSFGITLKSSNGTGVLIQSEQNRKTQLKKKTDQVWWLTAVIPATQEVEFRRILEVSH
jgi:hypothetical protein